jgi:hypothetical protein
VSAHYNHPLWFCQLSAKLLPKLTWFRVRRDDVASSLWEIVFYIRPKNFSLSILIDILSLYIKTGLLHPPSLFYYLNDIKV